MDNQTLKAFVSFLQQKYGKGPRAIANREPVSVKIPMFQKGADDDQPPALPMGGMGGGMGGMGDLAAMMGGGMPQPQDPMAAMGAAPAAPVDPMMPPMGPGIN